MKILTENQQLENKAKEVWDNYIIMDNKSDKLKNELNNYMYRLFKSEGSQRVLQYEIQIHESITRQLYDYQEMLRELIKK